VVAAEIPSTVSAEFRRRLAASLLVLLQLLGTAESPNVAYLDLLTGLEGGVDCEGWSWNRLSSSWRICRRLVLSVSCGLRVSMSFRL